MGRQALWALVSVATRNCDSARSDKRSVESPDVAVVRRSRAGRVEGQTNTRLVDLLQWGWADTAAGALAGRRARRGSQEEEAARRHHTLAGAGRRRARRCGQEQKPESVPKRG
jgi:hypothetical protein